MKELPVGGAYERQNVNMTSGSITRGLLTMTVPIMIMNVAQSLVGVMDIAVLRVFGYEEAVGAVGACGMLTVLCTSLLIGISAGANVVVAGTLKGMGKPVAPALTSLVFLCLLRLVWVYFIFPEVQNMTFLYLVWPIGWALSGITLLAIFLFTMSRRKWRSGVRHNQEVLP